MFKLLLSFVFITGFTTRQQERLAELLCSKAKSEELCRKHLIRESIERDPPGNFSLELEPIAGKEAVYRLQQKDMPIGEHFLLASVDPLTNAISFHCEFAIRETGAFSIFSKNGIECVDEIPIILKNLIKGQPVWIVAVSKEQNTCTKTIFAFDPFTASANEVDFSLVVSNPNATRFNLTGKRLNPGEFLLVTEQSGKRIIQHRIRADSKGSFFLSIHPFIPGKLGGQASLSIRRFDGECVIEHSWGGALRQTQYQQHMSLSAT